MKGICLVGNQALDDGRRVAAVPFPDHFAVGVEDLQARPSQRRAVGDVRGTDADAGLLKFEQQNGITVIVRRDISVIVHFAVFVNAEFRGEIRKIEQIPVRYLYEGNHIRHVGLQIFEQNVPALESVFCYPGFVHIR